MRNLLKVLIILIFIAGGAAVIWWQFFSDGAAEDNSIDTSAGQGQHETPGSGTVAGNAGGTSATGWAMVIEPQFDQVTEFVEGIAAVQTGGWPDGVWGIIDTAGNFVIPQIYNSIGNIHQFHSSPYTEFPLDYFVVSQAGRYGVINRAGDTIVPFEFDEAFIQQDNEHLVVAVDGRFGLINLATGEEIRPPQHLWIRVADGFVIITDGEDWDNPGKASKLDMQGNVVIPPIYDVIHEFWHGMATVAIGQHWDDRLWGVVGMDGEVILPTQFNNLHVLTEEFIAVQDPATEHWGVVNLANENVLPWIFTEINYLGGGRVRAGHGFYPNNSVAIIDLHTGEDIIPKDMFNWINTSFEADLALVMTGSWGADRSVGIIDTNTFEEIIPIGLYNEVILHDDLGLAIVHEGWGEYSRAGMIDLATGQLVVPIEFYSIQVVSREVIAKAVSGTWAGWSFEEREWQLIDRTGTPISPMLFNEVQGFSDTLVAVGQGEYFRHYDWFTFNGEWGLMDASGQLVLPVEFGSISHAVDGLALVNTSASWAEVGMGIGLNMVFEGYWGIIDEAGNFIAPAEMDFCHVQFGGGDMLRVERDGLWGFVRLER
ncbi:MAG: WG repeat-containing protein [Defluviitaleaceae bacterium]|nr:WG repeat-containing protein [Defluviitaleaceae bacterium]